MHSDQEYERQHQGTGDTIVATLRRDNAVLVLRYAIFAGGTRMPSATVETNWRDVLTRATTALAVP